MEDAVEASIVTPQRDRRIPTQVRTRTSRMSRTRVRQTPATRIGTPWSRLSWGRDSICWQTAPTGIGPTLRRPAGTAIPILSDGSPSASTDDTRYQTDLHSGSSTRTQPTCSGTTCTIAYGTDTATQTLVEGTSLETLLSVRLIYYTYRDVDLDLTLRTQSDPSNPRLEQDVRRQPGLQHVRLFRGADPRRNEPQHEVRVRVQ